MNLETVLERMLWEKNQTKIEQEVRKFETILFGLQADGSELDTARKAMIGTFASILALLLSTGKVIWLMTGRTAPRKDQVGKDLKARIETAKSSLFSTFEQHIRGLPLRDELTSALQVPFDQIQAGVESQFFNQEDPLLTKEAAPIGAAPATGNSPRLPILFLSAEPMRTKAGKRPGDALNLDVELREIQRVIESSRFRDQIDLVSVLATTPQELLDAMNRVRPRIVHFSGHGNVTDGIALVNDAGEAEHLGHDFLVAVFATLSTEIRIVVLNACFTEGQARAISSSIPVTVGTARQISDDAAIRFSKAFYAGIANGLAVSQAFGQAEAMLASVDPLHRPTLLARDHIDTTSMKLIRDPSTDDFEPLAMALSSSTKEFLDRPAPFNEFLSRAAMTPYFNNSTPPGTPIEKPQIAALRRLRRLLEEEIEKGKEYSEALDGISRRWSKHLGDSAVGKLTRLEQAAATYSTEVRKFSRRVFDILDMLAEVLESDEVWNSEHVFLLDSLTSTFQTLAKFLTTANQGVKVHYNQLIELLPGGLITRGLLRAL
jgi:hypothetical protein